MNRYWPLVLLLLIPFLWWAQRLTRIDLSPNHLRISGIIRSLIIVLLVFALIQPVIYRSGTQVSIAYLLDISQSISPADIESAIQWIQKTNDSGAPDHVSYIAFGSNAAVFDTLDQLRTVKVDALAAQGVIGQNETDITEAVEIAVQTFAPHHLKRLVLLTDGNENVGQIARMIPRLKTQGIQVHTVPLPGRSDGDLWIESMISPAEVAAGESFPVEVHVYSEGGTTARIELRDGERTLGSRDVQLMPGLNRIAFETSIEDKSGSVTLEAEAAAGDDTFPGNNKFRQSIVVNGRPNVLYVEGQAEAAQYLRGALEREGFAVETRGPDGVPSTVGGYDAYHAVIMSDVARRSLTEDQMSAMRTYVRELGGGFILSGGEAIYGGGDGYSDTDVERILPVTFESKRPHRSVAMIVVLDKSGSMGGPNFELAKAATKAPLQFLADSDNFGVVAFDATFFWAVPYQRAEHRLLMLDWISRLVTGGETDIYPALQAANAALANDPSEVKHVILLSDGHTPNDPFRELVEAMARARITVSTVALGTAADKTLLASIAEWGQGRSYFAVNASRVPQIFTDEAELISGTALREGPFVPIVKKNVELLKGIDFREIPPLRGYIATKSKENSQVLLESDRNDPVLARWQYGLGKTAAFASDAKNRWAADWIGWSGYSKFWSQLVRETMRSHDNEVDMRVVRDGKTAKIAIEAIRKEGRFHNQEDYELRVVRPDQSVSNVPVRQVSPGLYEVEFDLLQEGPYVFRVITGNGEVSRTLEYSYPDEYHFYPPDVDLLRRVSDETNGRFQPAGPEIFEAARQNVNVPIHLWSYFVVLALVLYVGDVYLRRVRIG